MFLADSRLRTFWAQKYIFYLQTNVQSSYGDVLPDFARRDESHGRLFSDSARAPELATLLLTTTTAPAVDAGTLRFISRGSATAVSALFRLTCDPRVPPTRHVDCWLQTSARSPCNAKRSDSRIEVGRATRMHTAKCATVVQRANATIVGPGHQHVDTTSEQVRTILETRTLRYASGTTRLRARFPRAERIFLFPCGRIPANAQCCRSTRRVERYVPVSTVLTNVLCGCIPAKYQRMSFNPQIRKVRTS